MAIRIVRPGSPRVAGEGLRIGTVRRAPRGVPRAGAEERVRTRDWQNVWFPNLAPSVETMKLARAATTPAQWSVAN